MLLRFPSRLLLGPSCRSFCSASLSSSSSVPSSSPPPSSPLSSPPEPNQMLSLFVKYKNEYKFLPRLYRGNQNDGKHYSIPRWIEEEVKEKNAKSTFSDYRSAVMAMSCHMLNPKQLGYGWCALPEPFFIYKHPSRKFDSRYPPMSPHGLSIDNKYFYPLGHWLDKEAFPNDWITIDCLDGTMIKDSFYSSLLEGREGKRTRALYSAIVEWHDEQLEEEEERNSLLADLKNLMQGHNDGDPSFVLQGETADKVTNLCLSYLDLLSQYEMSQIVDRSKILRLPGSGLLQENPFTGGASLATDDWHHFFHFNLRTGTLIIEEVLERESRIEVNNMDPQWVTAMRSVHFPHSFMARKPPSMPHMEYALSWPRDSMKYTC